MPLERLSDYAFIYEPNGVRFVMRDAGGQYYAFLPEKPSLMYLARPTQGSGRTYSRPIAG
jgi:hypothetical protein